MPDERIDIEIKDKVSPNVAKKILRIAANARKADTHVKSLKKSLATINTTPFSRISAAQTKTALGQQKVRTEIERTTAARQRAIAATKRAEIATLRLKTAKDKLADSNKKVRSSFSKTISSLGSFLTLAKAYVAFRFAKSIIALADAFTLLQNKLKNVSDSQQQLNTLSRRLFEIANRSRTDINATTQAFQRFDLALKHTGASQEESLRLTETLNKLLILSGATTMEQTSALLQLSQAFNEGVLRGQEFRIISQTMPAVLNKIAESMGVARGELKKMASEGKLTVQVLRDALRQLQQETDERFSKTVSTVGQAFIVLKNSVTKFIGELDSVIGASRIISGAIIALAENLDILAVAAAGAGAGLIVAFGPSFLAMMKATVLAVKAFTVALASNPIGLIAVAISSVVAALTIFRDDIKVTKDSVVSFGDVVRSVWELIEMGFVEVGETITDVWTLALNFVNKHLSKWTTFVADIFKSVINFIKKSVNGFIALWVGAYNSIIKGWDLFPGAMKDIVITASNSVIDVVENMINGVFAKINKLLKLANDASKFIRGKEIFSFKDVDLSGFKKEVSGAASDLAGVISNEMSNAIETDFVGVGLNGLLDGFKSITTEIIQRARQFAIARKAALQDKTRPAGAGPAQTPDQTAKNRADAIAKVNRGLDSQIRLLQLRKVITAEEAQIQERLSQIALTLGNQEIKLTETEVKSFKEKLKTIQQGSDLQNELQKIQANTVDFQLQQLEKRNSRIKQLEQQGLITQKQAAAASLEIWRKKQDIQLQTAETFFGHLSGLQNSENKKQARIGRAAAIVGATIDTYKAATGAYSSLASVPYVGPALGAAAAASAISVGLANVQRIRSAGNFQDGGIVPGTSFSGDNLTARVNSREMILNQSQQAQLFRMATGKTSGTSSRDAQAKVNVYVENYGSSEITVEQLGENDIRIIAKEVASKTVREEAPSVIAGDISQPNGRVSKSIAQNTTAQRRR